jgi:hypothetical protein
MRAPLFFKGRNLFLLQEEASREHSHGAQEPLNAPQLDGLPIE